MNSGRRASTVVVVATFAFWVAFLKLCGVVLPAPAFAQAAAHDDAARAARHDTATHRDGTEAHREKQQRYNTNTTSLSSRWRHYSRLLQSGSDFDELNALMQDAVVRLPDTTAAEGLVLDLDVTSVRCTNFFIGNVDVAHERPETSMNFAFLLELAVQGLGLECTADYSYRTLLFRGSGNVRMESVGNNANVVAAVETTAGASTSSSIPTLARLEACNSEIAVTDLQLSSSILGLAPVESILRRILQRQANTLVCETLSDLVTTQVTNDVLPEINAVLDGYYAQAAFVDPLAPEKALVLEREAAAPPPAAPSSSPPLGMLLNLLDRKTSAGQWVDLASDQVVSFLSEAVPSTAPSTTYGQEMRINQLVRDNVLNEDGTYSFLLADLFEKDRIVFEREDRLTATTMTLDSVKVLGLDSFGVFDPVKEIGNHTLQGNLSWDSLFFELGITLAIKPSTRADSFLENGSTADGIVENIVIKVGVEESSSVASLLLAVDQRAFEEIKLGSLLRKDNLLPCLAHAAVDAQLSSLSISIVNVQPPTLDGFVSPGIDRVASSLVDSAFALYETALLEILPTVFQTNVRSYLNEQLRVYRERNGDGTSSCPSVMMESRGGFVDFRDLFATRGVGMDAVGGVDLPYGDLVPAMLAVLDERFIANGENGRPKSNTYIQSGMETQSGKRDRLAFPGDLVSLEQSNILPNLTAVLNTIEFKLFDVEVANLDTLVQPLRLFNVSSANELSNEVNLGVVGRPITISWRLLLDVQGDQKSALNMRNDVNVSVSLDSLTIFADIVGTAREDEILNLPVEHLANVHCWLNTVPLHGVDESKNDTNSGSTVGINLTAFETLIGELSVSARCESCTSPGGEAIGDILLTVEEAGIMALLQENVQPLLNDIATGYWEAMNMPQLIRQSRKLCPLSPSFDERAVSSFEFPRLVEHLPRTVLRRAGVLTVFAVEVATVFVAKSHLMRPVEPTTPLDGQSRLVVPDGAAYVDWRNLTDSVGSWGNDALSEARQMLTETTEDENEPGVNVMIRNYLLGTDGWFSTELKDFSLSLGPNQTLELVRVRVKGLDTMKDVDLLRTIEAQTFENTLLFDSLECELIFEVSFEPTATPELVTISFGLDKVEIDFAFLIAVDLNRLGEIRLGSLLEKNLIIPCVISKLADFDFPQVLVRIDSITTPTVSGFFSGDDVSTLETLNDALFGSFQSELVAAVPKLADLTGRKVLNSILSEYRSENTSRCVSMAQEINADAIDLRDLFLPPQRAVSLGGSGTSLYGDTIPSAYAVIEQKLKEAQAGNNTINDAFIRPWTERQSGTPGTIVLPGEVVDFNSTVRISGLNAYFEVKVSDIGIFNLDSVGQPLRLIRPVAESPYFLNNDIAFGVGEDQPVRLTMTIKLSVTDFDELNMSNEFDVDVEIQGALLSLGLYLAIAQGPFYNFPLNAAYDPYCWLATVSTETLQSMTKDDNLVRYRLSADNVSLNVSCVQCSAPRFDELVGSLYSPGRTDAEIDQFVDTALQYVDRLLGSDFLQGLIVKAAENGARVCPHSSKYDPAETPGHYLASPSTFFGFEPSQRDTKMVLFNVANAVIAGLVFAGAIVWRSLSSRRDTEFLKSLNESEVAILVQETETQKEQDEFLNAKTEPMYRNEQIPRPIRLLTPFILVLDIGLYLGGHIGLLSYVNVQAQIAGDQFTIKHFLEFSFFKTAVKTFRAGGAEMAIFVIILSGMWPYIKLSTALALFYVSPEKISVSRRGSIFLWLDVLTKLSIIDIFTVLLICATLVVYAGGPADISGPLDEELYSVKAVIVPVASFYCILIAQRINRVSSRFFLDYHRKIVASSSREHAVSVHRSKHLSSCVDDTSTLPTQREQSVSPLKRISPRLREAASTVEEESKVEEEMLETGDGGSRVGEAEAVPWTSECFCDELTTNIPGQLKCVDNTPDAVLRQREFGVKKGRSFCVVVKQRTFVAGTIGFAFGICGAVTLFIVGAALAPKVSLDINNVLSVALESGRTYEEAVDDFNIFRVISLLLSQTSFILDTTSDYVGLGILIAVGIVTGAVFPVMEGISRFRMWRKERKHKDWMSVLSGSEQQNHITAYLDSKRSWKNIQVYVVAFLLAIWQLSAITAYAIHNYCVVLEIVYDALLYIGLVDDTSANCFRIQASDPSTILIIVCSFLLLLCSFLVQASGQYKKNKADLDSIRST